MASHSTKEYNALWRKNNPEKVRATWQRANKKDPEKSKRWRKANPEKVKSSMLKIRYGITLDEYKILLEKQGYRCAICRTDKAGQNGTFHTDHDHKTQKVRGLLCSNCNHGLGIFKDSEDILLKAIVYLRQ